VAHHRIIAGHPRVPGPHPRAQSRRLSAL